MPRLIRLLAGALIALSTTAALAASGSMIVPLKQSRRITLGGQAANVAVTDPTIADVAVVDGRSIVVMGRAYGTTDVLVLDHAGRTLLNSLITVAAPDDRVTVFSGSTPADYSCSPRCARMVSSPKDASGG